jgi:hypothetical protein
MDEYVEWLAMLGKDALPEASSIEWAVKAEEHRQLKVRPSPTAKLVGQTWTDELRPPAHRL